MIDPRKYVVYNRHDFQLSMRNGFVPMELEDAVVIRKRDAFAHVGLSAYAAAVLTVAELIQSSTVVSEEKASQLLEIADFFASAADEARQMVSKLPD